MAIENTPRTGRDFNRPATETRTFETRPGVEPRAPERPFVDRAPDRVEPRTDVAKTTRGAVVGGSSTQAVIGACVLALAIIGLCGILPGYLAPIATIVGGAGLVLAGGTIAARYWQVLDDIGHNDTGTMTELGAGISTEVLTGLACITLGIIALAGVHMLTLLPVAMIVFGGGLLLSAGSVSRLNVVTMSDRTHPTVFGLAKHAAWGATGMQILVGAGMVVLGILALIGYYPMTLSQVALLGLGGALLISGSAFAARVAVFSGHRR